MPKKKEECKQNVKAKEVIRTLCEFLSVLNVESVPTPEVFRRAKFNKTHAVSESFLRATLTSHNTHNPKSFIKTQMYDKIFTYIFYSRPKSCGVCSSVSLRRSSNQTAHAQN